jgi:hypothetical protein
MSLTLAGERAYSTNPSCNPFHRGTAADVLKRSEARTIGRRMRRWKPTVTFCQVMPTSGTQRRSQRLELLADLVDRVIALARRNDLLDRRAILGLRAGGLGCARGGWSSTAADRNAGVPL